MSEIFKNVNNDPKSSLTIDLEKQTITDNTSGKSESFEINPYKKECLLKGLDDIDYLLSKTNDIEKYEESRSF